jgi:hypothetical protein
MTTKDEALKLALEGAANYIDVLGGDSRKYRQALAAQQEPDWKAEYLKSVESGCITLDELREARAELDATNRQVEILSDALAESRREPVTGCACRWDHEDNRVVTCERHQGWLDVIAEWADRAREAEAKLKATPPAAPVQDSTCNNSLREQGKAYPRTCRKCGKGPCIALVNAALDKKAENARELGLDYEPVVWWDAKLGFFDEKHFDQLRPLYTTPPAAQRQWVGLTDEEIIKATENIAGRKNIARAIEAKLKERNT